MFVPADAETEKNTPIASKRAGCSKNRDTRPCRRRRGGTL